MKTGWAISFGVVCGLLGAGLILLASRPPHGEPIQLLPPPTAARLVVHVTGAVLNPGVYSLPNDGRVQDALQAAGGLRPGANADALNLAGFVQDGERIWVASQELSSPQPTGDSTAEKTEPEKQNPEPGLVNINNASQAELESLPGIGPVTAQKIIAHREARGLFTSIEAIQDVSGIGPATFERIKDLISLGP